MSEIVAATSLEGGKTWSTPRRVDTVNGAREFDPSIAVDAGDTFAIGYYAMNAAAQTDGALSTRFVVVQSSNDGKSFYGRARLASPFDMRSFPTANGYFAGDYVGATALRRDFSFAFPVANGTAAQPKSSVDVAKVPALTTG